MDTKLLLDALSNVVVAGISSIEGLALYIDSMDDNDFRVVLLYDPSEEKLIGGADIEFDSTNDLWFVSGIYAEKGWGPTLYLILMSLSEPHGLAASPGGDDGHTRQDAMNVWRNFYDGVGKDLVTKEKLEDDRDHDEEALTHKYLPIKKLNWKKAVKNHESHQSNNPDIVDSLREQAAEQWENI